ncbi:MAG: hypothetical protein LBL27_00635, partial [Coriobacteriales bacterium]|nr:hypothetical protein [Coriobacteriales bacterium]
YTGGQKWDGSWFYFNRKAEMQPGLLEWGGGKFYLNPTNESGRMLTGWRKVSGTWYYFRGGDSGRAETGWFYWGSGWFYFNSKAEMLTGWQHLTYSGKKDYYYFLGGDSGRMLAGKQTIDDVRYTFASGGALISPSPPPGFPK